MIVASRRLELPRAVKLLGLGGVGSIAARYLALYLASLEEDLRLVLVDGDAFEEKNAARMFFADAGNKAAVVRSELVGLLGNTRLAIEAIESFVTAENVGRLVQAGDLVLLAVDNHATRKLVSDHCATLAEVTLISGGNDGVGADARGKELRGTYGNVQVYVRRGGRDRSASLTAHHPEIANPTDTPPDELSCLELAASVPQILFTNMQTATCMLNATRLHLTSELPYAELHFDVHHGRMQPSTEPAPDYHA